MNRLKFVALLFSVLCLTGTITGIQAISIRPSGMDIAHLDVVGRYLSLIFAIVFAALAFGIHTKAEATWKAGFVLLALSYVYFVAGATMATYRAAPVKDFPSFWLPVGLVVVLGGGVSIYWGMWWKRQRAYFFPAD